MSVMSQPFGSRSWSWNGRAGRRGTCTCGGTFTCFVRAESEQRAWTCSGRAHLENIARMPTMSGFTKFHQNLTTVSPAGVPITKRLLPHHFINPANTFMPNLSFPALHAACHLPQVFAAAKSLPPISAGVGGPSDIKEQTQINAKNIKELQDFLAIPGFLQGCRL